MDIKLELFAGAIADAIECAIQYKHISTDEINSRAISVLEEIQKVIKDDNISDFDAIEKIVCIFEKYKISASPRHDFG